jgi:hypothetical protein
MSYGLTETERAAAERVGREQLERRLIAERDADEAARLEELRESYRRGAPSSKMNSVGERLRWLTDLSRGHWSLSADMPVPIVDEGEYESCVTAAAGAVRAIVQPLIEQTERELEEATRERDEFARGR